jgi:hypothetical protein
MASTSHADDKTVNLELGRPLSLLTQVPGTQQAVKPEKSGAETRVRASFERVPPPPCRWE